LTVAVYATQESVDALAREVTDPLDEEFDAALASPIPAPEIALEDVYANPARAEDVLLPYRRRS